MPINRQWNLDALNPLLSAIVQDNPEVADYIDMLCTRVDASDRATHPMPDQFIDADWAGFGTMPDLEDGGTYGEVQPVRGYTRRGNYRQKGAKVVFTRLVLEDDLHGIVPILAGQLRDSFVKTQNYQLAGVFVRSTDTTNTRYLGRDAKPWIAVDHPTGQGGGAARANTHTDTAGDYVSKPFGYESIQELLIKRERHTDMLGDPEPLYKPGQKFNFVLQAEDRMEYYKILGAMANYEPSTKYAAPNVLKAAAAWGNEPIVNSYISAVGADSVIRPYWMFAGEDTGLELKERRKYGSSQYLQDGDKSLVHDADGRYDYSLRTYKEVSGGGF